jgi:hypothetical protein
MSREWSSGIVSHEAMGFVYLPDELIKNSLPVRFGRRMTDSSKRESENRCNLRILELSLFDPLQTGIAEGPVDIVLDC